MKRRLVLAGGVAVAAGTAAAVSAGRFPMLSDWLGLVPRHALGDDIDALLSVAVGAGVSGEQFAALGDNAAELANQLRASLPVQAGKPLAADTASKILAAAVAADFEADRVFEHAGWVLSASEARLARLRWLVAGKRVIAGDAPADQGPIVQVEDWGPRQTVEGVPFLVQGDGHYGLWFKADNPPAWIQVRVNGHDMPTFVASDSVTSGVHGEHRSLIDRPGKYRIEFLDPPTGRVQHVGDFEVITRPAPFVHADGSSSKVFCAVEGWGPQQLVAGMPENVQPDGSTGLWIRTSCVPPDSSVMLGDVRLATSVQTTSVTARIPLALIEAAGDQALTIVHFGSNERLPIGTLKVLPGS